MSMRLRQPFRRRSRLEKAVKAARDAQLPSVTDIRPPKAIKSGATAVVAATAASAVVSAVRRRIEGPESNR
jgi:hypothetical protein